MHVLAFKIGKSPFVVCQLFRLSWAIPFRTHPPTVKTRANHIPKLVSWVVFATLAATSSILTYRLPHHHLTKHVNPYSLITFTSTLAFHFHYPSTQLGVTVVVTGHGTGVADMRGQVDVVHDMANLMIWQPHHSKPPTNPALGRNLLWFCQLGDEF